MSQSVNRERWKGLVQEWLTASGHLANEEIAVDAAEVECKPDTFVRCNMEMVQYLERMFICIYIYTYVHTHIYIYVISATVRGEL